MELTILDLGNLPGDVLDDLASPFLARWDSVDFSNHLRSPAFRSISSCSLFPFPQLALPRPPSIDNPKVSSLLFAKAKQHRLGYQHTLY